MHSTLFSAVVTVVSRRNTTCRAETDTGERTRDRLQGFHTAVSFSREEFELFQTVVHTSISSETVLIPESEE